MTTRNRHALLSLCLPVLTYGTDAQKQALQAFAGRSRRSLPHRHHKSIRRAQRGE